MIQRSLVMEGSLDEFDLVSVVQTISIGRQCTGVELRDERGSVVGTLLVKAGQIVAADTDGLSGLEAVRRLITTPKSRRFYVYRAPGAALTERVGPVTQVLAEVLAPPSAPATPPILMQGSLAEHDLRSVAEAVSLGRQAVGIEVFAPDGRRVGALYLKGGKVLFAAWGRSAGEPALAELFKPRKDGRFVVFRSPEARVGEPLARLVDVLHPKRPPPSARPVQSGTDSLIIEVEDASGADPDGEDTQVAHVAQQPAEPRPSESSAPPRGGPTPERAAGSARRTVPPPPPRALKAPPVARETSERPPAPPAPLAGQAASLARLASVVPPATRPEPQRPTPETSPPAPQDASPQASGAAPAPSVAPVARRSFPPPGADPERPESQAAAAPRFRRSQPPGDDGRSLLRDDDRGVGPVAVPPAARRTPVVCVTSARGGAGRTTLALNLAVSLARRGRRVTVVDADDNGILPALNARSGHTYAGVADVLEARVALGDALLDTRIDGLRLLPSGPLSDETYRHEGWAPLLSTLAGQSDLVLIDCAPVHYGSTLTVLGSASHQLPVVVAEPSATGFLRSYQARLRELMTSPPPTLGLVINMLDYQVSASLRAFEELCMGEHAALVFDTTIPRSPAFMEASARGTPIVHAENGASPTIAWVFETLATAILERLELEVPCFARAPLA